jgi:hypothetical protein
MYGQDNILMCTLKTYLFASFLVLYEHHLLQQASWHCLSNRRAFAYFGLVAEYRGMFAPDMQARGVPIGEHPRLPAEGALIAARGKPRLVCREAAMVLLLG